MNNSPTKYTACYVVSFCKQNECQHADGRWVPARPVNPFIGIRARIKLAWHVFWGKYDALDWEDE